MRGGGGGGLGLGAGPTVVGVSSASGDIAQLANAASTSDARRTAPPPPSSEQAPGLTQPASKQAIAVNLDDMHAKANIFFALNVDANAARGGGGGAPVPDDGSRFKAVVQKFPKLRAMLCKSKALQQLVATPGALRAFLTAATNGTAGIQELLMNAHYRDIVESAGSDKQRNDELEAVAQVRDELERFKLGPSWQPGLSPLPAEPTHFESESFITSQIASDAADTSLAVLYFQAYGPSMDVLLPFLILTVGASLAASLPPAVWVPTWAVFITVGVRTSAAAQALPSARAGLASLTGAATVQALLLVSAVQFAAVYVPDRWLSHRVTCILGLILILVTPAVFLSVYWVGPGYLPLATDSRGEWVGNMRRVSRSLTAHGGRAVAPEMAVAALVNSGRFCDTCHGARPLRSKHCAVCKRCVSRMDHHCPIVGTCVGAKNQRHFAAALGSMFVAQCIFISFSWLHISHVYVSGGVRADYALGGNGGGGGGDDAGKTFSKEGGGGGNGNGGGDLGFEPLTTQPLGIVTAMFAVLRVCPWALTLATIQCLCVCYCAILAARMTFLVAGLGSYTHSTH